MPEGDTVWLAGRRLHQALAGRELTQTDFRVPALATVDLGGRRVLEVASRGKHLLTRIDDGQTLHTHFRMDGAWHLYRPGSRWRGGPDWQVRVVLRTAEQVAVGYRLPVVDLIPTDDEAAVVGHLGPDLLDDGWDAPEALRRLRARPERPIGEALLDQRVVAGLGLIYVTETLFLHAVTPWTAVGDVADHDRLLATGRRLLMANRDRWAQSTTGDLAPGRWHYVYERTGRQCRRCGTRVRRATQGVAPHERLAYWCPTCQVGPGPG